MDIEEFIKENKKLRYEKIMKAIKLETPEQYDAFTTYRKEIEDLKLDDLIDLRNEMIRKIEDTSKYYSDRYLEIGLQIVETQIERLKSLPGQQNLEKEMMKAICYCEKYGFSFLDCPHQIMQRKFPVLVGKYIIQDLKQKAANIYFGSNTKERQKICEPLFESEVLSKEQVEESYKYYKCENCGTLNESTFYPCSKCGYYLY